MVETAPHEHFPSGVESAHAAPYYFVHEKGSTLAYHTKRASVLVLNGRSAVDRARQGDPELAADLDLLFSVKNPGPVRHTPAPRFSPTNLVLHLARDCNLRCDYCYGAGGSYGGSRRLMTGETAERAVRFLFDAAPPREPLVVTFFGGEPLLNKKVLRRTVEYAAELGRARRRPVSFTMTSNMTLMDEATADFLREHGVTVLVSIDGDRAQNDAHRRHKNGKGTYDDILAGYALYRNRTGADLAARATMCPGKIDAKERIAHLRSVGFAGAMVGTSSAPPGKGAHFGAEATGRLIDYLDRELDGYLAALESGETPEPISLHNDFPGLVARFDGGSARCIGCGAGIGMVAVGVDGDLFACHRLAENPVNRIGDLERFDQKAWAAFVDRGVERRDTCRKCWAHAVCGGGCVADSLDTGGGILGCDEEWCRFTRAMGLAALRVHLAHRRMWKTQRIGAGTIVPSGACRSCP